MYYVVLGHGSGKNMTIELHKRLDICVKLYKQSQHPIIVTGRYSYLQEDESNETEAKLMKEYLLKQGIVSSMILVEDQARETIGNLWFVDHMLPNNDKNIVLISSDFHENRIERIRSKFFNDRVLKFVGVKSMDYETRIIREKAIIDKIYESHYGSMKNKFELWEYTSSYLPGYSNNPKYTREYIKQERLGKL